MTNQENDTEKNKEFPLEAYSSRYEWIGNWADESHDLTALAALPTADTIR